MIRSLSILVGFWLGAGSAAAESVDRIAAVVNNEVITLSEVYDIGRDFIDKEAGSQRDRRTAELKVLDELIRSVLIKQELYRLQMSVTEQQLNANTDLIIAQNKFKDQDELREALERDGYSWDMWLDSQREQLRVQLFQMAIIRPRIVESEDAMRDAYNRMVKDPNRPRIAEVGGLFMGYQAPSDEEKARVLSVAIEAKKMSEAGKTIATLAKELGMTDLGQDGGSMGTFREGELMGELNGPAFSVPVGSTSDPIVTSRGVYLIKPLKRDLQPIPAYDAIKQELSAQVFQSQYQREEDAWYQLQRKQTAVEIKLEEPDKL